MQEAIAREMQEMLTPETWWDGRKDYADRKMCLGMAFDRACGSLTMNEQLRLRSQLMDIIRELFPGRKIGIGIPSFNDHKDTTYSDVLLVIKHFGSFDAGTSPLITGG